MRTKGGLGKEARNPVLDPYFSERNGKPNCRTVLENGQKGTGLIKITRRKFHREARDRQLVATNEKNGLLLGPRQMARRKPWAHCIID